MIKDDYRTEMNKDVYAESNGGRGLEEHSTGTYSDDYVKWLENKVKELNLACVSVPKGTVCAMKGSGFCPHEFDNGKCNYTGSCVNKQTAR